MAGAGNKVPQCRRSQSNQSSGKLTFACLSSACVWTSASQLLLHGLCVLDSYESSVLASAAVPSCHKGATRVSPSNRKVPRRIGTSQAVKRTSAKVLSCCCWGGMLRAVWPVFKYNEGTWSSESRCADAESACLPAGPALRVAMQTAVLPVDSRLFVVSGTPLLGSASTPHHITGPGSQVYRSHFRCLNRSQMPTITTTLPMATGTMYLQSPQA